VPLADRDNDEAPAGQEGGLSLASHGTAARVVVTGAAALVLVLALVVARADGAAPEWRTYLAPVGACNGAEDASAAPRVQRRAVRCLVNWARAQDARTRLAPSRALRRAATIKGRNVAACKQFSHTPCNADVTAAVRASGYRFSTFGENLFATSQGVASARSVVSAWLRSPTHRETLLHPGFRELGAARVDAPQLLGSDRAVVWVTAFAAPG
jgi:uncharacterized protein YkwD